MENQEMNENCVKAGKKKKKKKKKKTGVDGEQSMFSDPPQALKESNCYFNVADMLPQKVGEKTVFKDLEVTLTEGTESLGIPIPVKEKKKPEQFAVNPLTSIVNSLASNNQVQQLTAISASNLNNDQLKQSHLAIAPTLTTNLAKNPDVSITPCNDKVAGNSATENQTAISTDRIAAKKKKKKKRKKKKNIPEVSMSSTKNDDETVITPPTCVKLQAEGDSCVLLVSHESFGSNRFPSEQQMRGGSTRIGNTDESKGTIKIKAVSGILTSVQNTENSDLLHSYNTSPTVLKPQFSEVPSDQDASLLKLTSSSYVVPPPHLSFCNQSMLCIGDTELSDIANNETQSDVPNNNGVASCPDLPADFQRECSNEIPEQSIASDSSVIETKNSVYSPGSIRCDGSIPNATEVQEPTKAQLRAARRALQEAQRAAKLAAKNEKVKSQSSKVTDQVKQLNTDKAVNKDIQKNLEKCVVKSIPVVTTANIVQKEGHSKSTQEKEKARKVRLFSHLPQTKSFDIILDQLQTNRVTVHPAILAVGAQYAQGIICGSNARCIALLSAFKAVINDYVTPPNKELSRDLADKLQMYMNFLASCRPLSVSMANAVKFLNHHIRHISSEKSDRQSKDILLNHIAKFVREEIFLAKDAICSSVGEKIVDGDVILTYANSSLVKTVLQKAFSNGKKFRVIVVDSRPTMEGREMLRSLIKIGIPCTYLFISAISYVMKEVTKVILGAHALQANGYVMSRVGSSQIALVASVYNVHVFVCCETYKFCERVHTDSFVYNELGDPHSLVKITNQSQHCCLQNWKDVSSLQLLNILYDVTPPDLVTAVVTEKGMLPCSSVPVVLRVRHAGSHVQQ